MVKIVLAHLCLNITSVKVVLAKGLLCLAIKMTIIKNIQLFHLRNSENDLVTIVK